MNENNFETKNRKIGFRNMHLTSIISMTMVLFLVGLLSLLLFMARDMSTYVKENINLSIVLDDQLSAKELVRIENYLKSTPYIKSVQHITKEAALKEHIESLGENPEEFLGYNPLLASLEVNLNADYANSDSVSIIESKLKAFPHINRIVYQKDMINLVNENVSRISIVLLALAAILLFISMVLINNTIRMMIYSNRFLINTMKLVGATSWFIRKPYVKRSVLNGLLASIISLILLSLAVVYVQNEFSLYEMMLEPGSAILVSLIVITVGISLTAASSYVSVGKFLRMSTNDLYML
jgi:cell division transport system permease protein